MSETVTCPSRRIFVVIPVVAFGFGILATVILAKSQADPYLGVYRQEAVAVASNETGQIVELLRPHGELVQPGDPLAVVKSSAVQSNLAQLNQDIAEVEAARVAAKKQVDIRLSMAVEQLDKEKLELQLQYADLLRQRLDVQTRLHAYMQSAAYGSQRITKLSSEVAEITGETPADRQRIDVAMAKNTTEVIETKIRLCEDRLTRIDERKAELPKTIAASEGIEELDARHAALVARREQAGEVKTSHTITSTVHGRVGVWRSEQGDVAFAEETLVEIFDSERPYVLLEVPVSELLELRVQRKVRVEFEGVSTHKPLEGIVQEIRSNAELNSDSARNPGGTTAYVRVVPTGRIWPTPPPGTTSRVYPL